MNRYLLLLISFFYLTTASANEASQGFSPTILIVDKSNTSYEKIIFDLLALQKLLLICPSQIPEPFIQTGFLLVPKAFEEAGKQNYRIIEFPKLNHFFQTCETGSILEYGIIEETIAPVVLDTLTSWLLETTTNF